MCDFSDNAIFRRNGEAVFVSFDKKVYEEEALLAASYHLTNRYSVLVRDEENMFTVIINPIIKGDEPASDNEIGRLIANALDEQLRLHLERRVGKLRDIIVKQAFSQIDVKKAISK